MTFESENAAVYAAKKSCDKELITQCSHRLFKPFVLVRFFGSPGAWENHSTISRIFFTMITLTVNPVK